MHANVFKFCMKWIWILVSVWFTFRILIHRLSLKGHMEEDIRTMPVGSSCMHLRHAITCLWGVFFFYAGFEKPLERRIRSEEQVNTGSITTGHAKEATASDVCQLPCIQWGCSWGSLQKRNLFVEGACTPHWEWVTTVDPETSEAKKGDFITDREYLFGERKTRWPIYFR